MNLKNTLVLFMLNFVFIYSTYSQVWDPIKGCVIDQASGDCIANTVGTALPFLTIIPDSRSGAMGDAGIAISPDANAMHFNPSKLAFADKDMSISATYTPWLSNIGVPDVYLAYLSGYKKINKQQAIGGSIRFFSLGEIDFRDSNGGSTGRGKPREFEIAGSYARQLGEQFSASLSAKYIYSNLAGGQQVDAIDVKPANSFAVDVGLTYFHNLSLGSIPSKLRYGLSLTNMGSKVTYIESLTRDFIPAQIGLGTTLEMDVDDYNQFNISFDIKKLMVPTPISRLDTQRFDVKPQNDIADYREKSLFNGMLGSFADAPGGLKEELREIYYSLGLEYWYAQQFAVRAGYYYENPLKGDRQFLTVGFGIRYNIFEMNFSYLVPTNNQQNPLDNTLRFSLIFNIGDNEKS